MNTTSETNRSKGIPKGRGKHLTVGGSATRGFGSRVKERERAKETDILVEKGKDIRPSNVCTGIRGAGRGEEDASSKGGSRDSIKDGSRDSSKDGSRDSSKKDGSRDGSSDGSRDSSKDGSRYSSHIAEKR